MKLLSMLGTVVRGDRLRFRGHFASEEYDVLLYSKGRGFNEAHYAFIFDMASALEAMRVAGRHASNPKLNLTWDDAGRINGKIRDTYMDRKSYRKAA